MLDLLSSLTITFDLLCNSGQGHTKDHTPRAQGRLDFKCLTTETNDQEVVTPVNDLLYRCNYSENTWFSFFSGDCQENEPKGVLGVSVSYHCPL